jgi:hypothetical protein
MPIVIHPLLELQLDRADPKQSRESLESVRNHEALPSSFRSVTYQDGKVEDSPGIAREEERSLIGTEKEGCPSRGAEELEQSNLRFFRLVALLSMDS